MGCVTPKSNKFCIVSNMLETITQDIKQAQGSFKSIFVVVFYRCSSYFAQHKIKLVRLCGIPTRLAYKVVVEFIMGIELPDRVVAGPGLAIFHGVGLVVNQRVLLGKNVTLRQNTTLGERRNGGEVPVVGDCVDVGSNVVIIGGVHIGKNVRIGAGAIIVTNCPDNTSFVSHKAQPVCSSKS